MATLRDIKKRIAAVENTQKITKAMKMVATAKLKRVQTRMFELRPYAEKMRSVLSSLVSGADREIHPLLSFRPRKTVEVIVMTSDRGLCGAFNTNILKAAQAHYNNLKKEGFNISINTIGKKSRDYFKKRGIPMRNSWTNLSGKVAYTDAQKIADDIKENYINGTIDEVTIIFNEFKSMIAQNIMIVKNASCAYEILEFAGNKKADIYLMDIVLPDLDGIITIRKLLKLDSNAKIIVVTMFDDPELIEEVFLSGAKGFFLKSDPIKQIIYAINEVYKGRYYISPGISGPIVDRLILHSVKKNKSVFKLVLIDGFLIVENIFAEPLKIEIQIFK